MPNATYRSYTAITPVDSGVAVGYANLLQADTAPWGLSYLANGVFSTSGGSCGPGSPYATDSTSNVAVSDGVAHALAWDHQTHLLYEISDAATLRAFSVSGSSITGGASPINSGLTSNQFPVFVTNLTTGTRYFTTGDAAIYTLTGGSLSLQTITGTSHMNSLSLGYENHLYALDSSTHLLWAWDGSSPPATFASTAVTGAGTQNSVVIGPDGKMYAATGALTFQQVARGASSATTTSFTTTSGSGNSQYMFEGRNGYVYMVVNDYTGSSSLFVHRISH